MAEADIHVQTKLEIKSSDCERNGYFKIAMISSHSYIWTFVFFRLHGEAECDQCLRFFDRRLAVGEWGRTVQRAQQQWACPEGRGASSCILRALLLWQDLDRIPAALGVARVPGPTLLSGQFCEHGTLPVDSLSAESHHVEFLLHATKHSDSSTQQIN